MANYYEQCRVCGTYSNRQPCYECLEKERNLYKRAFEEVCRQFNYGTEADYEAMRDSFLRLAKEGADETL